MMGVLQDMKETLHQEEILVDDHHLTAKVLEYQEEGELVNRLMEILEMIDHQISWTPGDRGPPGPPGP